MTDETWWSEEAGEPGVPATPPPATPPSPPSTSAAPPVDGTWWTPDEDDAPPAPQGHQTPAAPPPWHPDLAEPTASATPVDDPPLYSQPVDAQPVYAQPIDPAPATALRQRRSFGSRLARVDRTRLVAVLAVAAAIAGLVFSVQHALDDQRVFDPTTIQLARGVGDVDPGSSGAGAAVDMPDVRDMKRDRALTIVGESGVPAGKITVEQVDQAGEADIVVNQDPAPGTNNPDAVTVYVSRPVAMPDYLNRAQKDVVTQLQQLGANPTIEYKFQAGTTEGAVLSQSVPAGSPMPADVSLVVAGQGAQVPIDLVQRVESDCSTGTESVIKGVTYPTSVECSVSYSSSSREPDRTTYVLSGEFDAVSVALGVTDDSTLGYQARLKVLVDGQVRAEQVLSPGGAPFVAVIPTTGAIQLSFEATFVGTPPSSSYPSVSAVFGSPTLLTSPDIAAKYQKGN